MKLNKIVIFALLAVLMVANSCSYKRLTYLQDMDTLTTYDLTESEDVRIRKGDKIKITVTCSQPELAVPFNVVSGTPTISGDGAIAKASVSVNSEAEEGYLVNKSGNITFPVLGDIHVEGMTLEELKADITNQIVEKKYIKDPIVLADFINFQITILGEVGSKGNYVVKNSKMTILEAIAQSGDLTNAAIRDDVWVIRTEDGHRKVYSVNLLSKSCFDSPAFYLQQGDVVYVKPRKAKLDANGQLALSITSTVLAGLSTIASVLYWVSVAGVFTK